MMGRSTQRSDPTSKALGLTLVELMVAMVLGLLITLAAIATLTVARQGFASTDAAAQLRDNARFAQAMLQRIGGQAGFRNLRPELPSGVSIAGQQDRPPYVYGINNATRTSSTVWDERSAAGPQGSDLLVLRYHASTLDGREGGEADGSIIDCLGNSDAEESDGEPLVSIFYVANDSSGEPSLMCARSNDGTAPFDSQPLVQGVENFQVLYGVNGIAANNTAAPSPPTESADSAGQPNPSIANRYLRADQLTISGNTAQTYANWRRVRTLRIGLVLRSAPGSAIDDTAQTFYPLAGSQQATAGAAFSDASNDPGSAYSPNNSDRRLRHSITFTIHLRNAEEDTQ